MTTPVCDNTLAIRARLQEQLERMRDGAYLISFTRDDVERILSAMTSKPKLLPCPFCGSVDMPSVEHAPGEARGEWRVKCWKCGAEGSQRWTEPEAVAAWNRREGRTGGSHA